MSILSSDPLESFAIHLNIKQILGILHSLLIIHIMGHIFLGYNTIEHILIGIHHCCVVKQKLTLNLYCIRKLGKRLSFLVKDIRKRVRVEKSLNHQKVKIFAELISSWQFSQVQPN